MNSIFVSGNQLVFGGKAYRCAFGKYGFSSDKKEGDGCSPIGVFALRELWYRADKMSAPVTKLPLRVIRENDGWCDDVNSPDYNKSIHIPCHFSHEKLWRDDGLYDLIIPLGYNDEPIIAGKGSAIFMHIAKPDYSGTEGCVALSKEDMLEILPKLSVASVISIEGAVA